MQPRSQFCLFAVFVWLMQIQALFLASREPFADVRRLKSPAKVSDLSEDGEASVDGERP